MDLFVELLIIDVFPSLGGVVRTQDGILQQGIKGYGRFRQQRAIRPDNEGLTHILTETGTGTDEPIGEIVLSVPP